jgi:hypothetical protein
MVKPLPSASDGLGRHAPTARRSRDGAGERRQATSKAQAKASGFRLMP